MTVTPEEPKGRFKRSKSKDNVQDSGEEDGKGSRGFMKWYKSKEHVDFEPAKGVLRKSKSKEKLHEVAEKPRRSKDSSSDSNKSESKSIKKRDKPRTQKNFMSVEEEMLLKSLDSWYQHIDPNLPDEFLTEEDRAVKRLKTLYEDDVLKERPVAHKPKDSLAISKPLLNSVVLNPKLERIFRDPKLPSVDGEVRQSALEDVCFAPESKERTPDEALPKSRSMQDMNVFEEFRTESELAPVTNTQLYNRTSSEIHPNDSVSNPRYSTDHLLDNQLPQPRISVNYENLDEIIATIPKDMPEKKLSQQQQFALKLKQALDEAEKQTTLKRLKKKSSVRGVEISAPTQESVEKNWKLKEVLMNPKIPRAEDQKARKRHSTDICSDFGSPFNTPNFTKASSKSHEDISFNFIPENTLLNMHYAAQHSKESSSSSSFTSAEFNLDTGRIVEKCEIPFQLKTDSREDLLYNDTLNKTKNNEKPQLADEDVHHPKIIEARNNYKHELQKVLKRIEHDELRKSLRKQRSQDDLRELHVVAKTMEIDALVPPPHGYEDEEVTRKSELYLYKYESAKTICINTSQESILFQEPEVNEAVEKNAILQQPVAVEERHFEVPHLIDAEDLNLQVFHMKSLSNENEDEFPSEGKLKWELPQLLLVKGTPTEKVLTLPEVVEHLQRRTICLGPLVDLEPDWQMPHVNQRVEEGEHPKQELLKSPVEAEIKWQLPQVNHLVEENEETIQRTQNLERPVEAKLQWQVPEVSDFVGDQCEPEEDLKWHESHFAEETPKPTFEAELEWQMPQVSQRVEEILNIEECEQHPKQDEFLQRPVEAEINWPQVSLVVEEDEKSQSTLSLHEPFNYPQHQKNLELPAEAKLEWPVPEVSEQYELEEHFVEAPNTKPRQESVKYSVEAEMEWQMPHASQFIEEERKRVLSFYGDCHRSQQEEDLNPQMEENLQWQVAHVEPFNEEEMTAEEQGQMADNNWEVPLTCEPSGIEETLKENQYGVVSPPEIRSCYRTVVKEYKSRFHPEEPEPEPNLPNNPAIGDFFNHRVEAKLDEESALSRSEAISSIDEEMNAILGRYMNTTASLLVQTSLPQETFPIAEPLSLEDQQLIEEMRAKYDSDDTVSTSDVVEEEQKKKARPLSGLNEADLLLIDMARRQSAQVEKPEPVPPLPSTPNPQQEKVAPVKWRRLLPPSLQPKVPADGHVVMRNSRPSPETSKRFSDLMFTETIFVPIATTPENEQVFVIPKYEPVYSNVGFKKFESPKAAHKGAIKKPLPLPRDNLAGPRNLDVADFDKMSEAELNSSRVGDKEANVRGESKEDPIWVEESKAHTDIVSKLEEAGEEARAVQEENQNAESDVEEIARNSSNVNLFHMDSPMSYDSYLELFKSKESKEFDALLGKGPETRPKIVDFVPLDDKTTSVFTPENNSFDTLEREKTFHVLEHAAKISTPNVSASLEVLAQKSSTTASKSSSTSRTSFSQAKKLFEALAEANKEEKPRPKSNRDSKSWQQLRQKPSKEITPDLPKPDSKDH